MKLVPVYPDESPQEDENYPKPDIRGFAKTFEPEKHGTSI
jgi:hypothetical protein